MKTSKHPRLAYVATLALLVLSSSVVVVGAAAAAKPAGGAGAQNADARARRKKAAARRRRARRSVPVATERTREIQLAPRVVVGTPDVDASGGVTADIPTPSEPTRKKTMIVSGGVLNGKAISKPQPAYPPIARAARASGTVTVQIVVGEDGRVISASAVSGHPLLQQSAVAAAREARFSPTLLSGQPVKVSGFITYNFVLK